MIKAFTAYTGEIDDTDAAVAEILEQLKDHPEISARSVGLLACYSDFVDSGVVAELCRVLPFEVIGSTTLGSIVRDSAGKMLLTLIVLSGEGIEFSAGLTEPMTEVDEKPLREAYVKASGKLSGKPALMITFAPLHVEASGDFYVDVFTKISGGVPNFGMLPIDNTVDYKNAAVISGGVTYADRAAFLLIGGDVRPEFYIASILPERISAEKAVVTSSRRNLMMAVNGKPIVDYMLSLGLKKDPDGNLVGINTFPFVVDYNDGTFPVARVMFAVTPDGAVVCGGDIPEGATMSVAHIDSAEILQTTEDALEDALSGTNAGCMLMFSCVGRYYTLGHTPTSEMELVQKMMKENDIPYFFVYSGGELCPVGRMNGESEELTNRNHNDTFVLCKL